MLVEISIADLALIEAQSLQFGPGLNVVTGETGTGKSTVLHAVELVLGGKPKAHMVREGATQLEVQALFDLQHLPEHIRNELPDIAQAEELAITRTVAASGRGRIYINGKVATQAILEQVGARLVTLCGQSAHIRLLQPLAHLEFIDQFGGHGDLLTEYRARYDVWRRLRQELQERERAEAQRDRLLEELEFRRGELEGAEVRLGLRLELEEKIHRLSNAEKLIAAGGRIQGVLDGETGLTSVLRAVEIELGHLARLDGAGRPMDTSGKDSNVAELTETFAQIERALSMFEGALGDYLASVEVDEEELEELRSKLAEVARLERKYKTNDAGLEQLLVTTLSELDELTGGVSLRVLRDDERAAQAEAMAAAQVLSRARSDAASRFAEMVAVELAELNMRGGGVEPQFTQEPHLGPNGAERCEFFFIAHSGETPKPLRQIASGGELSRLTLILKKLLRDDAGINVLVFDEVDTGISGSVARAVGLKLRELAQHSQVLCITHLPQVASLADEHFLVEKVLGNRAMTVVRHLSSDERVDEVARMLSGFTITPASRESARELLGER